MFYKKFISALLAVILFVFAVCSVPVPAQASDRGGAYVNILDYATIKGRTDNYISISNGSSATVTWDFTDTLGQVRGFEFEIWGTYRSADFTVDSVTFGTVAATDVSLETPYSGIFRITGNFHDTSRSTVSVKLTSSATTYFNFERLFIYTVGTNRVPLTATINDGSTNTDFTGGVVTVPYSNVHANDHIYSIIVPFHQWSACDYVDLNFYLDTLSITSISAFIYDGMYVPADISFINPGPDIDENFQSYTYFVNMRLDLRDVSPGTEDTDMTIILSHSYEGSCTLGMINLVGTFLSDGVDPDSVWHRVIYRELLAGFNDLASMFSSMQQTLMQMNTRVNNVVTAIGDLRTTFINQISDIRLLLSENTRLITEALSSLKMTVDLDFRDLVQHLDSWFNEFKGFFQQLINGTPVDETVTNEMQDAENELGGMTDQMDELSPTVDVGNVNVNIDDYVDPGATVQVTNVLSIITNQPIIVSMLSILASFALMGYVFFGKR